MSRIQNLDRQRLRAQHLRAHALLGAASLCAVLTLTAAEAAPRKRTPWVDPPGPGQTVVPETPPATGALPAATPPAPAKAEAAQPAGQTGAASAVAADSSSKEHAAKKAAAKPDAQAGRKDRKVARSKHVRTAQSRRAKPPAEARASRQRVEDDLQPFDDELTYDEVVRNGVEIDPRTIAGLPPGYRVYSLRSITTVTPVGPPVVVMRQPWPNGAFVPYRRF